MADFYGIPDFVFFLLGITFLLYLYLTKNFGYWKNQGISEVPPMIITGSIGLDFKTNQGKLEQQWYKKYGKVFGIYEGSHPVLMVADPELLKDILVKDFNYFSDQRPLRFGDPIVDKSLVTQSGERWKELRNIISPTFTSGKMRLMAKDSNYCTQTVADNFLEAARENKEVDVNKYFAAFVMDVIAKCAFGVKLDSRKDPNNPFVIAARETFGPIPWRFLIANLFPDFAKLIRLSAFNPRTSAFFKKIVIQVIRERENLKSKEKPVDFLQLMMDAKGQENENENKRFDLDDIISQSVIFFIAGFLGMAGILSFTAHQLAINPDIQDKLINEIDEVFKAEGILDYDTINSMVYLDAVLEEVMRFYTLSIRLERKAVMDYKLGNTGITIEKNTVVAIPAYAIHHDPKYFPDPDKFDPNRFLSEERKNILPYTSMPFGIGPRNCIGMRFAQMQMKMALAKVLQYVKFKPGINTKEEVEIYYARGVNRPKNVFLKLVERKS